MTNNIRIDDQLLSKTQLTIIYSTLKGWVLIDGDLECSRASTNGTWIYLDRPHKLQNNSQIKLSHTLFGVSLGGNI